jgi:hypothetical protein
MPLSERRPWARRILVSSAVVWLIVGVGYLAHLSGLPAELPSALVSAAVVVDANGRATDWQNAPAKVRFEQERVQREMAKVASLLQSLQQSNQQSALSIQSDRVIRPFRFPLRFTLNFRSPEAFSIDAKQVELGSEIASSPGQVQHAVLRAWIQQTLSSGFSLPLLRQTVIADILMAIGEGELALGVPGSEERISYSGEERSSLLGVGKNMETFLGEIASLSQVCRSEWRPTDLGKLCKQLLTTAIPPSTRASSPSLSLSHASSPSLSSHETGAGEVISPMSFRRLLGTIIWQNLSRLNSLERLQLAREWVRYLKSPEEGTVAAEEPDGEASLWRWREWLDKEFDAIYPLMGVNESRFNLSAPLREKLRAPYVASLRQAGLDTESELVVDIAAHFTSRPAADEFRESMFARSKVADRSVAVVRAAIIESPAEDGVSPAETGNPMDTRNSAHAGSVLAPGMIRVSEADLTRLRARAMIWDSCTLPTVSDLLGDRVRANRVLVVRVCPRTKPGETDEKSPSPLYRAYLRYGVEGFALDNQDVAFVQLHRPSLEFAFEQKLFDPRIFIKDLFENTKPPVADRKLGLAEAEWNNEFRAYRVLGAIEAVQWYRPLTTPKP